MARLVMGFALFLPAGCSLAPWRVWQQKVPAAQSEKPPGQIEGERRGAAYIRLRSTPPVPDAARAIADIHPVAEALASSLGEPQHPPAVDDKAATIAALHVGLQAKDRQLEAWKAFGRKYGGMPIEGTGISLAGPAGLIGLIALIAACVAFPALGYLVLRVVPVLWGALRGTATAVEHFAAAVPHQAAVLESHLAQRHTPAQTRLFRRIRGAAKDKSLDHSTTLS